MSLKRPVHNQRQYRRGWSLFPRHSALDYGFITGDAKSREVLSAAIGIVTKVVNNKKANTIGSGEYGNMIEIRHTNRAVTRYAHNAHGTATVKVNQKVGAGRVIATMGDTGDARGVHTHFELLIDGVKVDPAPYIAGKKLPGVPVIPRRTILRRVNARKGASTAAAITRKIKAGVGTFDAWREGEKVTQNGVTESRWVRAAFGGDWVWLGNLSPRNVDGLRKVK